MRTRRHHNNTGYRQIRRGKTRDYVRAMALRLGLQYGRHPIHEREDQTVQQCEGQPVHESEDQA